MRALLDVNVLIAVLDPDHAFHRTASGWLAEHAEHGWASCPLTQNGCIRIMAQPGYSSPVGHRQITDVYLLALAVKNDARLITFDARIPLSCVHGAQARHLVVL